MVTMKMTAPANVPGFGGLQHHNGDTGKSIQAAGTPNRQAEITADDFEGDVKVSSKLPTVADLERVAELPVLDADGQSQPFQNIHSGPKAAQRVLLIFVRHFFCGVSASLPQSLYKTTLTAPRTARNTSEPYHRPFSQKHSSASPHLHKSSS